METSQLSVAAVTECPDRGSLLTRQTAEIARLEASRFWFPRQAAIAGLLVVTAAAPVLAVELFDPFVYRRVWLLALVLLVLLAAPAAGYVLVRRLWLPRRGSDRELARWLVADRTRAARALPPGPTVAVELLSAYDLRSHPDFPALAQGHLADAGLRRR